MVNTSSSPTWYEQLANVIEMEIVQMFRKGVVRGETQIPEIEGPKCPACLLGEVYKAKNTERRPTECSPELWNLVHTNVCGPMNAASIERARDFISLIGDHVKIVNTYLYDT